MLVSLVVVLCVAFALRLALVVALHGQPLYVWDERDYDTLAVNLVRHGQFAFEPGQLTSLRPPLYPVFLAAVYEAFGERCHSVVRVLQAVLGAATAGIVFLIGRRLYGERAGIVAAAICAAYPSLIMMSGLILTETLFTLLLCCCCLMMQEYLIAGRAWQAASLGCLLALGALTRSILWLFPPLLVLFFVVCGCPRVTIPRRLAHACLAVTVMVLVIAPWAIRNTRLQKTFTAVDVMGGRNLMMGNYEFTPFHRPWDAISISGEQAWYVVLRQEHSKAQGLTQGQLDKLALKYGLEYIWQHPFQSLQRGLAKMLHFWQLERETIAGLANGYWGRPSRLFVYLAAALILLAYTCTLLAGVWGILVRPPADWRMHIFLLLISVFVWGVHTLVFAHSRYHLPLMPLISLYAAAMANAPTDSWWKWRSSTVGLAVAVSLLLATAWSYELWVELGRL